MGLIAEASWKSCGRFRYSSNNEFLLAFKSSRFFFQSSVAANVVRVISVFHLFGLGKSLEREVIDSLVESVRPQPPTNCLFLDTFRQKCL